MDLNAALTRTLQYSVSLPESVQFLVLTPIYLIYILILSSHICLGLPKDLLTVGLPVKNLIVVLTLI